MNMDKNVPGIRFENFNELWLSNSIGNICGSTFGGGTPSTSEKSFWLGDIPWIQSSDIKESNINSVIAKKYITKVAVNNSSTKLISRNSIAIVTRVGVGKLSLMNNDYATSQDFLSLSNLKIDEQYATYAIWKLLQIEKEQVQGTSIKGITKEELLGKLINFPELRKEQTQIGNYFQKLDSLINQHKQKHDKLSQIKKAMLEKMFPKKGETTPEIRFKGFSGDWEMKELGTDVADIIGGGTPSTAISEFWDGDIDWYSPTEIGTNVYTKGSQKKITAQGLKSSSAKLLPGGNTVLFTSRAGIGDMAILTKPGATNQGFQSFIVKEGFSPYFVYSVGMQIKEYALKHASGSTFLEISGKQLGCMEILMPSSEEQKIIGNYFQKLDCLISQHQQQITKLNNIKQACLNKMFV